MDNLSATDLDVFSHLQQHYRVEDKNYIPPPPPKNIYLSSSFSVTYSISPTIW